MQIIKNRKNDKYYLQINLINYRKNLKMIKIKLKNILMNLN